MNEIEINVILVLICLVIIVSVCDPIYNSIIKNNSKGEKNHGNTKQARFKFRTIDKKK